MKKSNKYLIQILIDGLIVISPNKNKNYVELKVNDIIEYDFNFEYGIINNQEVNNLFIKEPGKKIYSLYSLIRDGLARDITVENERNDKLDDLGI